MKLREYFEKTDAARVIVVDHSLGNGISRNEIETVIQDAGYDLPTTGVQFYIVDTAKAWFVRYFVSLDKYGVEKLSMK